MIKQIFTRIADFNRDEKPFCKDFEIISSILDVKKAIVIPRYSALPDYKYLYNDIIRMGGTTLNTPEQFNYVADARNWYPDLRMETFLSWFSLDQLPKGIPFVVKGTTNSKKFTWKESMYAETKQDAIEKAIKLQNDYFFENQGLFIRKYEKLSTYTKGVHDLPITKEFRFFVCNQKVIAKGYYWSSHIDELEDLGIKPDVNEVPEEFISTIISKIGTNCNFYSFDVAQKENGSWILVELNSGEMSGLSCIDPATFYSNLSVSL